MSIQQTTPATSFSTARRSNRRIDIDDEAISPRRLQQIENATVVMATALSSSVVFYAFFTYVS